MEITPQIDGLLKSDVRDDQKIGIELLKHMNYTDFETFTYKYRYRFLFIEMDELFEYILTDPPHPVLGLDGVTHVDTRVKIIKFL